MRARPGLLAVVLLGALLPATGAAAEASQLTVTVSSSAAIEVRFATPARLALDQATADLGGGTWAVLHVEQYVESGFALDVFAAFVPDILHRSEPIELGMVDAELPAGRYRISLLTGTPTTVVVPAEGGAAGMVLRPTRPVELEQQTVDAPVTHPIPGRSEAMTRMVLDVRDRPFAIYAGTLVMEEGPAALFNFYTCLTTAEGRCSDRDPAFGLHDVGVLMQEGPRSSFIAYVDEDYLEPGGDYAAVSEYAGTTDPKAARGFALLAHFPPFEPATAPRPAPPAVPPPALPPMAPPGPGAPLPATGAEPPVLGLVALLAAAAARRRLSAVA